ncbi:hypothetical protein J4729_18265 [Leisingera sp. HS039]|uniref:hypothetical protein n=1 Tax=unclassified Leisingera TaxID=2614906 RepID=UPI001071043A|nr:MULTISPECIES: hypothetical protein [unclassified Leisingera]MBQ4826475.1 hypothetical protein [Leisingera sp. HS039]QBR36793.1 hypothetical protein ETW23_12260 [Leisingera sp. NJS201]
MFDVFSTIYAQNSEFINGVASTVTILGFIFGLSKRNNDKQKRIFYQWVRQERISFDLPAGFEAEVFNVTGGGKTLITDFITLSNRTDVTVTDDDFVNRPTFKKKNSSTIFASQIVDTNNGAHAQVDDIGDGIQISKICIPRNTALTVYLAHDSAIEKGIDATTKDLPDLTQRSFNKLHDTFLFTLPFFLAWMASFTGFFVWGLKTASEFQIPIWSYLIFIPFLGALLIASLQICAETLPRIVGEFIENRFSRNKDETRHAAKNVRQEVERRLALQNQDLEKA